MLNHKNIKGVKISYNKYNKKKIINLTTVRCLSRSSPQKSFNYFIYAAAAAPLRCI